MTYLPGQQFYHLLIVLQPGLLSLGVALGGHTRRIPQSPSTNRGCFFPGLLLLETGATTYDGPQYRPPVLPIEQPSFPVEHT